MMGRIKETTERAYDKACEYFDRTFEYLYPHTYEKVLKDLMAIVENDGIAPANIRRKYHLKEAK